MVFVRLVESAIKLNAAPHVGVWFTKNPGAYELYTAICCVVNGVALL